MHATVWGLRLNLGRPCPLEGIILALCVCVDAAAGGAGDGRHWLWQIHTGGRVASTWIFGLIPGCASQWSGSWWCLQAVERNHGVCVPAGAAVHPGGCSGSRAAAQYQGHGSTAQEAHHNRWGTHRSLIGHQAQQCCWACHGGISFHGMPVLKSAAFVRHSLSLYDMSALHAPYWLRCVLQTAPLLAKA